MTKNQLLALAAFITSLANEGEAPATETPVPSGDAPKPRRGRPPATPTPPAEPETPAAPATPAPPVEQPPATSATGKTYEGMQKVIEPLVKGTWIEPPQPRGAEVKAAIAKYAPTLRQMDPKDYDAFQADIEALLY